MNVFHKFIQVTFFCTIIFSSLINAQSEKERIAVIDLKGEITESESAALTGKVIDKILSTGKYLVFERSQMDEILKEQGFQQSGCTSDECAIEIGQLLGVRKIVFGNIEKIGTIYSILLKMVNIETGEIEKSISLDFKGTIETLLTEGIIEAVQQLTGIRPSEKALKKGLTLKTTFAVITAAAGVGSAGACIYFWTEKSRYHDKYLDANSQEQMDKYLEKEQTAYALAGVFTSVSAVCIPTSVILFVLRKKGKKKTKVSFNSFISPEIGKISFTCAF